MTEERFALYANIPLMRMRPHEWGTHFMMVE